jgi:hypothetical protein
LLLPLTLTQLDYTHVEVLTVGFGHALPRQKKAGRWVAVMKLGGTV